MLTLEYAWALLALPLPLIVRWLAPAHRESRTAVVVPFMQRLVELTGRTPAPGAVIRAPKWSQRLLVISCWVLVVVALARPQWIEDPITKTLPTRDLLLAVDLSGSMETEDFQDEAGQTVDRLTAVKEVLASFLDRRDGDRVGLIFFGSAAFVQAPFTDDLEVLGTLLDEAQVRMAGPKTVLGDAIGLAMTVFEESELDARVLIAMTDGNDTGSQVAPADAAAIARDRDITIHTVAVGDPEAAGEARLDEESLREIAATTGGTYTHAEDRDELEETYRAIEALDTREAETLSHRPKRDLFFWPIGVALVLSFVVHAGLLFSTTIRHRPKEDV